MLLVISSYLLVPVDIDMIMKVAIIYKPQDMAIRHNHDVCLEDTHRKTAYDQSIA